MDKIFSKKPWVQPLSVAGTSVDTSTTSSGEENEQQLSMDTLIFFLIILFTSFNIIY